MRTLRKTLRKRARDAPPREDARPHSHVIAIQQTVHFAQGLATQKRQGQRGNEAQMCETPTCRSAALALEQSSVRSHSQASKAQLLELPPVDALRPEVLGEVLRWMLPGVFREDLGELQTDLVKARGAGPWRQSCLFCDRTLLLECARATSDQTRD